MESVSTETGTWRPGILPATSREFPGQDVSEADMIIALGKRFGLGEDDLLTTAAATARSWDMRISDVILAGWQNYCQEGS
jgi:hypothetical protein